MTVEQTHNKNIGKNNPKLELQYKQPYGRVWKRTYITEIEGTSNINIDFVVSTSEYENNPTWKSFGVTAFRFSSYWGALAFLHNTNPDIKIRILHHSVVAKNETPDNRRVYKPVKDDLVFKHISTQNKEYNCEMSNGYVKTIVAIKANTTLVLKQ